MRKSEIQLLDVEQSVIDVEVTNRLLELESLIRVRHEDMRMVTLRPGNRLNSV